MSMSTVRWYRVEWKIPSFLMYALSYSRSVCARSRGGGARYIVAKQIRESHPGYSMEDAFKVILSCRLKKALCDKCQKSVEEDKAYFHEGDFWCEKCLES